MFKLNLLYSSVFTAVTKAHTTCAKSQHLLHYTHRLKCYMAVNGEMFLRQINKCGKLGALTMC